MPSAAPPNVRVGASDMDDLDKLLDYDNAVDDFLNDIPVGNSKHDNTQYAVAPEQFRDEDQEVQVKKKRAPVPKLDENRLLSDAGIPKLRKISKSRLKFHGKGHEFTDISRLLNTYQLWLDDLYPRAKFRDALTMVEKVGHSKRMQISRKAWLDDTKVSRRGLSPYTGAAGADGARDETVRESSIFADLNIENARASMDAPDDDELDALMAESGTNKSAAAQQSSGFGEEPNDDELNALLAEGAPTHTLAPAAAPQLPRRGPFEQDSDDEDELEALMAEQVISNAQGMKAGVIGPTLEQSGNNDFAEEEEVMASMGW